MQGIRNFYTGDSLTAGALAAGLPPDFVVHMNNWRWQKWWFLNVPKEDRQEEKPWPFCTKSKQACLFL